MLAVYTAKIQPFRLVDRAQEALDAVSDDIRDHDSPSTSNPDEDCLSTAFGVRVHDEETGLP